MAVWVFAWAMYAHLLKYIVPYGGVCMCRLSAENVDMVSQLYHSVFAIGMVKCFYRDTIVLKWTNSYVQCKLNAHIFIMRTLCVLIKQGYFSYCFEICYM